MALLTMFINRPVRTEIKRTVANGPAPIVMDAQVSEQFKADAEATQHPVESNADITDHVVIKPTELTITGIITETPFTVGSSLAGAASTVGSSVGSSLANKLGGSAVGGVAGAAVGGLAGKTLAGVLGLSPTNRLQGVITELLATRDSRAPVTIQTGLRVYEDYVLTGVQIERGQHDGRAIKCTLTFKQIIKASTEAVKVNIPKNPSGLAKKSLGRQATSDPDQAQGKGASLLFSGFKAGGLL